MTRKKALKVLKIGKVDNILLNLASGLKVKNLTKEEKKLLEKEYGKFWLRELGYKSE